MEGVGGVMQHDLFQQVSGGANPTPTLHVVPVKKKGSGGIRYHETL